MLVLRLSLNVTPLALVLIASGTRTRLENTFEWEQESINLQLHENVIQAKKELKVQVTQ